MFGAVDIEGIEFQKRAHQDIRQPAQCSGEDQNVLAARVLADRGSCPARRIAADSPVQPDDLNRFGGKTGWEGQQPGIAILHAREVLAFGEPLERSPHLLADSSGQLVQLAAFGQEHDDPASGLADRVEVGHHE